MRNATILNPSSRRKCAAGFAALVCTAAAIGAPAAAQGQAQSQNQTVIPTYNAMDADTLSKIIMAQGQAQITPDNSDPAGPHLKVQLANGINYAVLMDDCNGGTPNLCKSFEFRAQLPPGSLNFAQINSFNQTMRYATAYLGDKGVPELRMDETFRGGVTAEFVGYAVRIFVKVVSDYVAQAK
ncbi:MAG: putative sensory transduction regulator [Rhodospirillales bacterium]|nr:putative sensory transduction regulator [Rhodospirillales bacterium]